MYNSARRQMRYHAARVRRRETDPVSRDKVIVAVSGGVDSSVAAALLSEQFEVTAVHFTKLALPGLDDNVRERDDQGLKSARRAAEVLGVPLVVVEAGERFDGLVDFFCSQYNAGRTPNPCVLCNATIKWRLLIDVADEQGARFVATGHYARIEKDGGRFVLMKSAAEGKDQTYFLHRLDQTQLARTVFPLSALTKEQVREIARQRALPTVERSESQEICFVPDGGYGEILRGRTPGAIRGGEIVDWDGAVRGHHGGYQFFTIGQRKGTRVALGRPAYVVAIDPSSGRITLGDRTDLERTGLRADDVNWIDGPAPPAPFEATVRIRYNHEGAPAVVEPNGSRAVVRFARPVHAVTPGQAAVFYKGGRVIGGGWIADAIGGREFP